eukprot:356695-Chlamydomonas_euryale.AAC.7
MTHIHAARCNLQRSSLRQRGRPDEAAGTMQARPSPGLDRGAAGQLRAGLMCSRAHKGAPAALAPDLVPPAWRQCTSTINSALLQNTQAVDHARSYVQQQQLAQQQYPGRETVDGGDSIGSAHCTLQAISGLECRLECFFLLGMKSRCVWHHSCGSLCGSLCKDTALSVQNNSTLMPESPKLLARHT